MAAKILVVEDDEPILDLMDLLIRRLGYEPVLIPNGPDALVYTRNEPPALILLDIMMTPISGWEFLEKLRATMNDPLLGVLHKPVSLTELKAGIDRYIGQQ